jgi:putative ABC transport system permease protein
LKVTISGFFQRNDHEDQFSHLYQRALQAGLVPTFRALPLFISQGTYLRVLSPAIGNGLNTYAWMLDVAPERLTDDNASQAASDIIETQELVNDDIGYTQMTTALHQVFSEYDKRLFFTRSPMLVFLVLIAVVILYYVATISSLLIEQQKGDIALLRTRGANSLQILAVFVLEGGSIALLATALGPVLAAFGIAALGFAPMFSDLTGNTFIALEITRGAYIMSAVGGLLSFAALMVPAIQASRIGVTGQRQ